MTLPITLMSYVARRFAAMALLMVLSLSALVALFDLIELLRRAATRPEANFALVAQIAALRVP
jgi:lipopolysaccharide export system permease protein